MQPQIRFVLDPGHGGLEHAGRSSAYGARGPGGLAEKDVTVEIARRVRDRLGPSALLTREGDSNRTLADRAGVAAALEAPAFVSIHLGDGRYGRGRETFVHTQGSPASLRLAESLDRALEGITPGRSLQRGELAVLAPSYHHRDTAACLVEVGHLGDPAEEQRLRDPGTLDSIAGALADGLTRFGAAALDHSPMADSWGTPPSPMWPAPHHGSPGAARRYGVGIVNVQEAQAVPQRRSLQRSGHTQQGSYDTSVSFDYDEIWVAVSGRASTDNGDVRLTLTDDWGNNPPYLCTHSFQLYGASTVVLRFWGFPARPDSNPMRSCRLALDNSRDRGRSDVDIHIYV